MKATLEFDLPEERDEHSLAVHGAAWGMVVWDVLQELRGYIKHGHKFKDVEDALEQTREGVYDKMHMRGLSEEMLM